MFTVIIVVHSLKSMCVPSFIVISYCLSELYAIYVPIVMYGLRLFIVVLQELHCLPNFWYVYIIVFMDFYHFTKFRPSIQSGFFEIRELKLKSNNNNNKKKMKNCENEL